MPPPRQVTGVSDVPQAAADELSRMGPFANDDKAKETTGVKPTAGAAVWESANPRPPAQIPASGTTAPGSYLES